MHLLMQNLRHAVVWDLLHILEKDLKQAEVFAYVAAAVVRCAAYIA